MVLLTIFFSAPKFVSISCLSTFIFYTSLSIQIDAYFFLSLCQYKFTAISFKPVFVILVYSLYIHLKLFLSLVYSPLFLSICLSIQIHAYFFRSRFIYLSLILIYPSVSIFISFISTTITFYLLYNSLLIQLHVYLFQSQPLFVVRSSNLVHTVSLITNNYFYLSDRKEIENDTANISIDFGLTKG